MKRMMITTILSFFYACAIMRAADVGQELFQRALVKERAAGNLEEAIQLYQRVVREFGTDRPLAAKALLAAARCYEKLGQGKATRLYEEVLQKYADQPEQATAARDRLAALAGNGKAKVLDISAGLVVRQISLPPYVTSVYPDGAQNYYVDPVSDSLLAVGWGSTQGRLIFKRPSDCECGRIIGVSPSPDGKQVAMDLSGAGRPAFGVVETDGTGFRVLYKKPQRGGLQPVWGWSPDGSGFLATLLEEDRSASLVSISAVNGSPRKIANFGQFSAHEAKYSPDGRYIAFTLVKGIFRGGAATEDEDVLVMSADGSNAHKLIENSGTDRFLDWSPDGHYVIFASDRSGSTAIYALPIAAGKGIGPPTLITKLLHPVRTASMTRDGTLLYTNLQSRDDIYRVKIDSSSGKILGDAGPISSRLFDIRYTAAWSPDGRYLAYITRKGPSAKGELVLKIRAIDSGEERELILPNLRVVPDAKRRPYHTVMLITANLPKALVWSPDGTDLYFAFNDADKQTIFVERVSIRSGEFTHLAELSKNAISDFSPIGRWRRVDDMWLTSAGLLIRFSDPIGRGRYRTGVLRLDLTTKEVTEIISKEIAYEVVISPDGLRAAALDGMEQRTISVKEIAGGDWKVITKMPAGTVLDLQWTPDGSALRFIEETPAGAILWRLSAEGGEPEKLGETAGLMHMHRFLIHPDGSQALFQTQLGRTELWAIGNFLPKLSAAR